MRHLLVSRFQGTRFEIFPSWEDNVNLVHTTDMLPDELNLALQSASPFVNYCESPERGLASLVWRQIDLTIEI